MRKGLIEEIEEIDEIEKIEVIEQIDEIEGEFKGVFSLLLLGRRVGAG